MERPRSLPPNPTSNLRYPGELSKMTNVALRVKKVYFTLTIRPVHSKMSVYTPVAQLYRAIAS